MKKSLEIPGDLHEQFFRFLLLCAPVSKADCCRRTGISKVHPTVSKRCQIFSEGVSSLHIDRIVDLLIIKCSIYVWREVSSLADWANFELRYAEKHANNAAEHSTITLVVRYKTLLPYVCMIHPPPAFPTMLATPLITPGRLCALVCSPAACVTCSHCAVSKYRTW